MADAQPSTDKDQPLTFPHANIGAVNHVARALATGLGPTGRDTLLLTGEEGVRVRDTYVSTSDGTTILEAMPIQHPISEVLERVSGPERPGDTDVEGEQIPDGVTSTIVLLGSLLQQGLRLTEEGLHPHTVRTGYFAALETAVDTLNRAARTIVEFDDPNETERSIVKSAMTGGDIGAIREKTWVPIAIEAVNLVGMPDERSLAVRTIRDGSIDDSRLVRGAVLGRHKRADDAMPSTVDDARILVLGGYQERGGLQDPNIADEMVLDPSSPRAISDFETMFDDRREAMVSQLVEHDINVVIARSGISEDFQGRLADAGILGVRGVTQLLIKQVAEATGASIVKDPSDVGPNVLGHAGSVREVMTDPRPDGRRRRRMIVIDGCSNPGSVAILVRGVSGRLADTATTELRKGAAALALARGDHSRQGGVLPGGGAAESMIVEQVRDTATTHSSKVQLSMFAFADAVESLVATMARNGGMDPIDAIADLRSARSHGKTDPGIVLPDGYIEDAIGAGILDPLETRRSVYRTAVELSNIILNIDDAIDAITTTERPDPADARYDDAAEQMRDHQQMDS